MCAEAPLSVTMGRFTLRYRNAMTAPISGSSAASSAASSKAVLRSWARMAAVSE